MGQTWSLDLILAVGIFILFIIAFYVILSGQSDEDVQEELEDTASDIVIRLDAEAGPSKAGIIKDGKINETKLAELSEEDYEDLKQILGISNDFCIFLEDENGRLIPINGSKMGVGGSEITINGRPCNSTIG